MTVRYVYFFQADNGHVKIGQSGDPRVRLNTLSYVVGHRLTVIGVMPSDDARAEEIAIHRACDEHHFEGEWFRPDVRTKIESYRHRFLAELPEARRVLIQTAVSPELCEALEARAKNEGRTLANLMRYELGKIVGVTE